MRVELEMKADAVARMSASNISLRAEALNTKEELDQTKTKLEAAHRLAAEAEAKLKEQEVRARKELEAKMKGFSELESTCAGLRESVVKWQGEADYASARA